MNDSFKIERDDINQHIDMAAFENLKSLIGDKVFKIVEQFSQCGKELLVRMGESIKNNDAEQVCRDAHGLKGSSVSIAAVGLSSICEEIETLAKQGHMDEVAVLFDKASEEMLLVLDVYKSLTDK